MSLLEQCEQVSAHHGDRYQPFLKKFYGSHRKAQYISLKAKGGKSRQESSDLAYYQKAKQ